jgi:transcription-repair coupling factor (superfamily II helicase)
MAVKVRLRALAIRALEAGPGRLVLTLGETAALDPFLLAKHVQASAGRLRLTPDMKLVATLGAPPARPAKPPKGKPAPSAAGAKSAALRKVPAPVAVPAPSPAAEANAGREILEAARALLKDLARCARPA